MAVSLLELKRNLLELRSHLAEHSRGVFFQDLDAKFEFAVHLDVLENGAVFAARHDS